MADDTVFNNVLTEEQIAAAQLGTRFILLVCENGDTALGERLWHGHPEDMIQYGFRVVGWLPLKLCSQPVKPFYSIDDIRLDAYNWTGDLTKDSPKLLTNVWKGVE